MCKSGTSNGAFTVAAREICPIVLGFVLERAFARTRSYPENPNFHRIIAAWKFSYAQIRTQKRPFGLVRLGNTILFSLEVS